MLAGMELLSVIARLSLAALFGGLLGLERERKNRPAGLRTYLIVCVGAALTVLLSEYEQWMLSTHWVAAAGSAVQIDISRLGAQVINGIGFLGAGTILVSSRKKVRGLTTAAGLWASACMHYYTDITRLGAQVIAGIGFVGAGAIMVTRRRQVKGLTTAAGLWVSAIIGLSFGAGFYEGGAYAAMLLLLAELLLTRFEYRSLRYISRQSICIEYEARCQLDDFLSMLERNRIRLSHLEINRSGSSYCAIAAIRLPKGADAETLAAKAADIHGILRVYLL